VLRYQTHRASARLDRFLSPYRTAVWMVVCYDKAVALPADLLERLGPQPGATEAEQPEGGGDWREAELAEALIWASTHMQDMLTCRSDDEPRRRTELVRATLAHLSRRLVAAGDRDRRCPLLWGGMFAPLLRVGAPSSAGTRPADADVTVFVALHAEDVNGRWLEPLPALWAIAHGRATAAQVADAWATHRWMLLEGDGAEDPMMRPIHPRLAGGILCVEGVIPSELQMALLTRGGDVDLELVGEGMDRAVALVRGAVEALARSEAGAAGLRVLEGAFRQMVLREMRQFQQEEEE
jgi:hypothetical protein